MKGRKIIAMIMHYWAGLPGDKNLSVFRSMWHDILHAVQFEDRLQDITLPDIKEEREREVGLRAANLCQALRRTSRKDARNIPVKRRLLAVMPDQLHHGTA